MQPFPILTRQTRICGLRKSSDTDDIDADGRVQLCVTRWVSDLQCHLFCPVCACLGAKRRENFCTDTDYDGCQLEVGSDHGPRWTSAFLGTNDIFGRDVDDVVKRLSTFRTEELEFVSVVGGLKYLQILGRVNFSRITFYDSNVNELTKLRLVHKRIMSLTYDEWIKTGV